MDGKLVFIQPADGTGHLVFGETGVPVTPDALFTLDDDLPGLGSLSFATGVFAAIDDDDLPGLDGSIGVLWDANVSRGETHFARVHWQDGTTATSGLLERWQDAVRIGARAADHWQDAAAIAARAAEHWQDSQRLAHLATEHWQDAQQLRHAVLQRWQEAEALRHTVSQHWQDAAALRHVLNARWQETTRLRALHREHWQDAGAVRHLLLHQRGYGARINNRLATHWQDARRLPPGRSLLPGEGVVEQPCYDPEAIGRLVFSDAFDGTGRLVFVCERKAPVDPEPQPLYTIPVLEVYMSVHSIDAVLLPSLEKVTLASADIEADDDSFGWSLSASGAEHLLEQLAPVSGLPAQIRVTVDGISWVFAVERISRTRSFNKHRVSIEGRSVTALLSDPYMPAQTWLNDTSALTAQQIITQAMEFTGTALDWRLDDWIVPAGVWSFTGTPLEAALRVAEGMGAIVRSHKTAQQLIFAPRYASMPWEWVTATPHIEMPADIIVTDALRPDPRPAYNAVYLTGMAQGVRGLVRRTGTAGDVLAQAVTDNLLTHASALRERGRAILGAGGNKLIQDMTLPLLTGSGMPGLFEPGYLLKVNDIDGQWRGLVRSLRVSTSVTGEGAVVVRQSVSVERSA